MTDVPARGAARDAALGELLLGLHPCQLEKHRDFHPHGHSTENADPHDYYWYRAKVLFYKPYSTDKHTALDLLMEMQRRGWAGVVRAIAIGEPGQWADITIASFRRHSHEGVGISDDFPDAVSAAAYCALVEERETAHKAAGA